MCNLTKCAVLAKESLLFQPSDPLSHPYVGRDSPEGEDEGIIAAMITADVVATCDILSHKEGNIILLLSQSLSIHPVILARVFLRGVPFQTTRRVERLRNDRRNDPGEKAIPRL